MRFPLDKMLIVAGVLFALGIVLVIIYALVPQTGDQADSFHSFLGMGSMIAIVLAGLVYSLAAILSLVEIITSGNDIAYKLLWFVVLFFVSVPGFVANLFFGRKDLK